MGIEVLKNNSTRLLVFDPSNGGLSHFLTSPSSEPPSGLLRALRRGPGAVKSRQYQLVAVTGLLSSGEERSAAKVIHSVRIP